MKVFKLRCCGAFLIVCLVVLFGVACEDGTPIAADGSQAQPTDRTEAAYLAWAKCMREHGIPVKDPVNGQPPTLQYNSSSGPSREQIQQAANLCQSTLAGIGGQTGPGGAPSQAELDKAFAYAKCIREHGFKTYPDPKVVNGVIDINAPPDIDVQDPRFKEADRICYPLITGHPLP
jgi:hypothetical protein